MLNLENRKLGEINEDIDIDSSEHHRISAVTMATQCSTNIDIISRELDPHAYNTAEFVDAVKQMVLANRRARVRVMVFESQLIRQRGHRLLDLANNLSSFIEFRKPSPEYNQFNESLLVADKTGFILRLNAERFEGKVNFNDKRQSKVLLDKFEEMWGKAKPDPNLRQMHL